MSDEIHVPIKFTGQEAGLVRPTHWLVAMHAPSADLRARTAQRQAPACACIGF